MLDAEKKKQAHSEELDWCRKMGVWEKTSRVTMDTEVSEAISSRWVDTDMGDHTRSAYRSRVVARETEAELRACK
eukprot:13337074-Heterocapsa_arctica.AAC.1